MTESTEFPTVKDSLLDQSARHAFNVSYRNLRIGLIAGAVAMLVLTIGNVIAWTYVMRDEHADCLDRRDRVETNRRLWNGVFDVVEDSGGDSDVLLQLQGVVDRELPPVNC